MNPMERVKTIRESIVGPDGFRDKAKSWLRGLAWFGIGLVVVEPFVSLARYGEFEFFSSTSNLYLFVSLFSSLTILIVTRDGSETSLKKMIHSKNWIARIYGFSVFLTIFVLVGAFKVLAWIVDAVGDGKESNSRKDLDEESRNHSFTAPLGQIDPRMGEYGDGGINDRYF
ncbi:MAG: hypothetical protein JXR47_06025 [Thiotrichales bacterium]|nr:hypothetical protein [Thiotrichales bacterium]